MEQVAEAPAQAAFHGLGTVGGVVCRILSTVACHEHFGAVFPPSLAQNINHPLHGRFMTHLASGSLKELWLAYRPIVSTTLVLGLLFLWSISGAAARESNRVEQFLQTLSSGDRQAFERYYSAKTFHSAAEDAYWAKIESVRKNRRARIRRGERVSSSEYVTEHPPVYNGPQISGRLAKLWKAFQERDRGPGKKRTEYPTASDYLALAKRVYDFEPERIPEREFKRRYASEALALGLAKEQVVRVYALETGGRGTADMVAGVNPITGRGTPISSAMGYAQLLSANTINVLQQHGDVFESRLEKMHGRSSDPSRRQRLAEKITALRKMRAVVAKIPARWSAQRALARTDRGKAMHAINIDGDIGPWLQVKKLRDVKNYGTRAGYKTLTSEQLELMNLAGPGTGLEMMTDVGMKMPTSNFFSRLGYERNSIVRGKNGRISAELLQALGDRMDSFEKNPGAIEFAEVFDELQGQRSEARDDTDAPQRLKFVPAKIFFNND